MLYLTLAPYCAFLYAYQQATTPRMKSCWQDPGEEYYLARCGYYQDRADWY